MQGSIQKNDKLIRKGKIREYKGLELNITCEFVSEGTNEIIKYAPFEIASYSYNSGKTFASKIVLVNADSLAVFAEIIVQGNPQLYSAVNKFFIQYNDNSGELTNELLKGIESKNYLKTLGFILKDCKEVTEYLVSNPSYNKHWIEIAKKVITIYNKCDNDRPPLFKINYLPIIGLNASTLSFSSSPDPSLKFYSNQKYNNRKPVFLGLDFILLLRGHNKFGFTLGAWYLSEQFNFANSVNSEFNEFSWLNKSLNFSVGPKITFLKRSGLTIDLHLRPGLSKYLSFKSIRTQEIDKDGVIYSNESHLIASNNQFFYLIGLDFIYQNKGLSFFTNINYLGNSASTQVVDSKQLFNKSISSFLISVGVKF